MNISQRAPSCPFIFCIFTFLAIIPLNGCGKYIVHDMEINLQAEEIKVNEGNLYVDFK